MLRIVMDVDRPVGQAIGIKEALAMDLERYGDVRVVSVEEITPWKTGGDSQWLNLKSLFTEIRNGNLAEVSAGGIYRTARIASGSWG